MKVKGQEKMQCANTNHKIGVAVLSDKMGFKTREYRSIKGKGSLTGRNNNSACASNT